MFDGETTRLLARAAGRLHHVVTAELRRQLAAAEQLDLEAEGGRLPRLSGCSTAGIPSRATRASGSSSTGP